MHRNHPAAMAAALVASLSILALGGCGAENLPPETPEVAYKIPAATKYVSAASASAVRRLEGDGAKMVLDAASSLAQSVVEGDVLMFGITVQTPDGLLRKVTSRTVSAEGIELTTEEATVEEAFEELDLNLARPLAYEEMDSYDPKVQGLTVRRAPLTLKGGGTGKFELSFDSTVLYDHDKDPSTTDDQIVADGSLSFSVGVQFEVKISWFKLKRLKVGAKVSQEGKLAIRSTLAGLSFEKEVVLGKIKFAPFMVGPVVVRPLAELVLGASGELKVEVVTSVSEEIWAEAGALFENGKWTPYAGKGASWDFQPPALTASAQLKAYLGPRFTLMLYGVAGPYAQATAYLELSADPAKTPWWELYAGIEGALGIQGKILGKQFLKFHLGGLVELRVLLASAKDPSPCTPECGSLQCGPDPVCGASCGTCAEGGTCEVGLCVGGQAWKDPTSGLIWQVTPSSETMARSAAIASCQGLGGGWRLPTITELRSLIRGCAATVTGGACQASDLCKDFYTCSGNCWGCTENAGPAGGCYWPAEMQGSCEQNQDTYVSSDDAGMGYAWVVQFRTGGVSGYGAPSGLVRCVR